MSRSRKRHKQGKRARLRRQQDASRRATIEAPQEAATPQPQTAPEASETPVSSGGLGGPSGPEPTSYEGDLKGNRLEQRAITQRWPVPEKYRKALVNRQVTIGIDPTSSPKEATAAFRAVLAADLANMEQERRDQKIPEYHQHEHKGTVTVEERRQFWFQLGESLRDAPEQRERVAALLRKHIEAEQEAGAKKEPA